MNAGDAGRGASPRADDRRARRLGAHRALVPAAAHARAVGARPPAEAERLVARYDRFLSPGAHNTLTRTIAWGWVRTGDMNRARAALAATGAEGDSSDAAGWLALYEGNLKSARGLLRGGTESSPELALGARVDRAPQGRQRAGDRKSVSRARAQRQRRRRRAVRRRRPRQTPAVRSLLLLTAAQLQASMQDTTPRPSRSGSGFSSRRRIHPKRRRPSSSGRDCCAARATRPARRRISST